MDDDRPASVFEAPVDGSSDDGDATETQWNWPFIAGAAGVLLVVAVVIGAVWWQTKGSDEPVSTTTTTTTTTTVQVSTDFSVADLLPLDGQYSTLLALAEGTDLLDELSGDEEMTLLAPNVEAFEDAGVDADDTDASAAEALLRRHLLPGVVTLSDLIELDGSTVTNLADQELTVSVDGATVTVGDATILKGNIGASNGTIHVVSAVVPA